MTLTPEQIAAGWLPHDGHECPVPLHSKPAVKFRNGISPPAGRMSARFFADSGYDWWKHEECPHGYDIIAYLPEKSNG